MNYKSIHPNQSTNQHKVNHYKQLYHQQKIFRKFYQTKLNYDSFILKSLHLSKYQPSNKDNFAKEDYLKQLKDFSSTLNKGKFSKENSKISLIQNFVLYGIPQQFLKSSQTILNGQVLFTSEIPNDFIFDCIPQIFLQIPKVSKYYKEEAIDKCKQLLSLNYHSFKIFIISFNYQKILKQNMQQKCWPILLNILNPNRQLYGIYLSIPEYTTLQKQQFSIIISQKIYCIYSFYPFFQFFQKLLKGLINNMKLQKLIGYANCSQLLSQLDSSFNQKYIKKLYIDNLQRYKNLELEPNKYYSLNIGQEIINLDINFNDIQNISLEQSLTPIIRLFNLDKFLTVFVLIALEENIVFICPDKHILTCCIYLFVNILLRPFKYPYQVNYLLSNLDKIKSNGPFIYGYPNKKQYLKKWKNLRELNHKCIIIQNSIIKIIPKESQQESKIPKKIKLKLQKLFESYHKKNQLFIKNQQKIEILEEYPGEKFNYQSTSKCQSITLTIINQIHSYMKSIAKPSQQKSIAKRYISKNKNQKENKIFLDKILNTKEKDNFFQDFFFTKIYDTNKF